MTTSKHVGTRPEIALDVHGRAFRDANYAIYDDLRARTPVAWSTENGGFWVLTDYESTFDATRDDDLFTSTPGTNIPFTGQETGAGLAAILPPIHTDPPLTGAMRSLTTRFLSPARAEAMLPEIRAIADELIDEFIESGEADLVGQLTTPLPARVILRLLGWAEEPWPEWVTVIHTFIHGDEYGMTRDEATERVTNLIFGELGRREELGAPADDMVGCILNGQVEGRPLSVEEQFGYLLLLLFGGMDTTSGLTGNSLLRMIEQPSLKQQLLDRPELIRSATEEFLRHGTPTQGLARTVSRDTDWRGVRLAKGDRALLLWAAANRDPEAFENPAEINLERAPNRHMAFGVGQHRCLGSNHARVMFRVMVEQILARLPDFTLAGEPVRYGDAAAVYALKELPVRFTPGPRVGVPV
ncbi:cytochrome P450 [Cryptosporangium aurantiacum]|uniref:Cytochrome P450 n=1 Tax=Cryptosporangium aurantiacum TaxID=134849 RepID=A0A1M7RKA5_9ACTN|nr:cytochrome P450 [Cryptosporangium aurantiacum]SHN46592.1 Cytochrome P450 [Cryptosporangium aurantiacum]